MKLNYRYFSLLEKNEYAFGVVISIIILFLLSTLDKEIKRTELVFEKVTLASKPELKIEEGGRARTTSKWLEFNFFEEKQKLFIIAEDFKNTKYKELINEVGNRDTVYIAKIDNNIYSFIYSGKEYMNFDKARKDYKHSHESIKFMICIFLIFCVIPLLIKKTIIIKSENIIIGYNVLATILFILIISVYYYYTLGI
jgi:hypothetical protein